METALQARSVSHGHLGAIFFHRVEELGDRTFVKLQRGERFEEISWRDFGANVGKTILALYFLGVAKGDRVAIIGENSLSWLCADIATLAGGFPNVIASPSLSDMALLKMLGHSRCRAAFVENETTVGRLLNLKGQLPALQHLIVMDGTASGASPALAFEELLARGSGNTSAHLNEVLQSIHTEDLASIMYTSGSTGEPKGVMRTQGNLLSNISNGSEIVLSKPEELAVIVLSLNHLLGRFGFLKSAVTGRSTAVIEDTEQSLNIKVIAALSPTAMTIVPRVMEKMWNNFLDEGTNQTQWEALERLDRLRENEDGLSADAARRYEVLKTSLKEAVKRDLGGRIKYITYGGAPMPPRIMHFFRLIGIPLLGTYGSTECGGVSLSGLGDSKPGSLGKPFPNVEVCIAGDGEILVRGPTVTPGYFENPEATREAIDADGWYHSGDLGKIDSDGCLYVVGRKKDVFYCSDGSNIYPGYIELLLENDRFIGQAILLGDRRPFMAALIVADRKAIADWSKKEETELADGEVEAVVQLRIDQINAKLEEVEKIRKIIVMRYGFPTEARSVTVFQKIKIDRSAVEKLYEKEIKSIYSQVVEGGGT
jgi:long-chain acyl-CoA synthetase